MRESLELRGGPQNIGGTLKPWRTPIPRGDPDVLGGLEGAGTPQCPAPPPRDRGSLSQFGTRLTGVPGAQVREPPAGGEGLTGDTGRDWRELGRAERGTGGRWEGAGGVWGCWEGLGELDRNGEDWEGEGRELR